MKEMPSMKKLNKEVEAEEAAAEKVSPCLAVFAGWVVLRRVCCTPHTAPLAAYVSTTCATYFQVLANIRKEAEKVKGGEDRIEEIIAAKMRDMGLKESAGVLKIPEHCVVNSRVSCPP